MNIIFYCMSLVFLCGVGYADVTTAAESGNDDAGFEDITLQTKPIKLKLDNSATIGSPESLPESNSRSETIVTADNMVKFPYGLSQPKLICGKMRACMIELAEGEEILDASPGDTERWTYKVSYQVTNDASRPVITVKPFFGNNIETNIVIVTNKRIYDVQLKSIDSGDYTPRIGFYYPEQNASVLLPHKEHKDQTDSSSIKVEQMNFDYRLMGNKKLEWFPVMVFDDGKKVYIKMSERVKYMELPVFVGVTEKGVKEIVNYRYREPFMIIDKIFNEGMLILNNDNQKIVKISRSK
ncbi:MAG: TrbG/VirB9 family P-type conjugative transfer protein [Candidatus Omnitrophica bacterium]|nr:TrbG/VirB9 family P-type conjugative transfer protein [Candidatus Omnitrophota bacterium]